MDAAPAFLSRPDGERIAYQHSPGSGPGVVFLGGFHSDMDGAKARHVAAWCEARGYACVRFDYFGHGASSGRFEDGTIGRWAADAVAVLDALTQGPQVLVGSSMGGWLMLLAALARPQRVAGLLGIAAAPDFVEDLIWAGLDTSQRAHLMAEGAIERPSAYADGPYRIARRLIEEGREHLLLRGSIALTCPLRLLHGMADADVPWQTSLRLLQAYTGTDARLELLKDGEHRLSREADLARLEATLATLIASPAA